MQVIGLTGYAGAGKSTAAQYLVEKHGFTRLSFAAPLKNMLRTLDPIIKAIRVGADKDEVWTIRLSDLEGWTEIEIKESIYGDEYRRLLQLLGTDCIRAEQEDFWIEAAGRQLTKPWGKYVFDDCRFPNEAEFIKSRNPLGLWTIMRPGFGKANGHVSEQHAGNMGESIILLNRDLEGLQGQLDKAVEYNFKSVSA